MSQTVRITKKYITSPGSQGDGLTLCDGKHYVIDNCIIDFSNQDLDDIDECLGITWGCSAEISNCIFCGAGKLVLCGSGDKDKAGREHGQIVRFTNCIFENFGRRGPEVQCGMQVYLTDCLIRNWGEPDRFTVRSFGAWAHGAGSFIIADSCIFWQDNGRFGKHWFKDMVGHIGQAWNDERFLGLFSKDAWRPGNARGLVESDGGCVMAKNCYTNQAWVVIENHSEPMLPVVARQKMLDFGMLESQIKTVTGLLS